MSMKLISEGYQFYAIHNVKPSLNFKSNEVLKTVLNVGIMVNYIDTRNNFFTIY